MNDPANSTTYPVRTAPGRRQPHEGHRYRKSPRTSRTASVVLAFLTLVGTALGTGCTAEQLELHRMVNLEREDSGRDTLLPSPHAYAKAQAWAETMAAESHLRHSNLLDGMPGGFLQLGENVGRGPGTAEIHTAFLDSPAHRANLLDPTYQWIGTGAARGRDGALYVAVVLARY
jgi:uncharacterized protein YkwD